MIRAPGRLSGGFSKAARGAPGGPGPGVSGTCRATLPGAEAARVRRARGGLRSMGAGPRAMLINDGLGVWAANGIADSLFAGVPGTLAGYVFAAPAAREFYVGGGGVAAATAGQLRLTAGR